MNKINFDNIPEEIYKIFEVRCKIFANLIEHESLSCKCPADIKDRGFLCDVCDVGRILKVYNDRVNIRSNLSETRPTFPCRCSNYENDCFDFNSEDSRCDVCKVIILLLVTIRMYCIIG